MCAEAGVAVEEEDWCAASAHADAMLPEGMLLPAMPPALTVLPAVGMATCEMTYVSGSEAVWLTSKFAVRRTRKSCGSNPREPNTLFFDNVLP